MTPFRPARDGSVRARFDADEAALLAQIAAESSELVQRAARDEPGARVDPAAVRLLPDAYPEDAEASAEFRRFTAEGLAERKAHNARILMESLRRDGDDPVSVHLDHAQAITWLRALTDMRLMLAARLGIVRDGDDGAAHDAESVFLRAVYDWLGAVQESLVLALER